VRLLLSAYACRPNAGSEPGYGWNWATHLASRGFEVHVLVAQRNQQAVEAGLGTAATKNVHFHFVRVPYEWIKKSESLHYLCWQASALRIARKLHAELRFQVSHHVTYGSIHVATQLWRLGIPVIFGPVGGGQIAPASMLAYFGSDRSRELCRTTLTRALKLSPFHRHSLKRMSWVLAANRDTLELVRSLGCKDATLMCDAGIPDDHFANQPRKFAQGCGTLKLLWVGRILTRKALPLALDVLKEVNPGVTLTIAGDAADPEKVRQMIRDRNLQHRVFWRGTRLTRTELRNVYTEHDAMLFTSLRDTFGSQLLEAMAMGLPVITLDMHGAHDFVPENASLKVPVGSPGETVRNLACVVEQYASLSTERRNEMSEHAWTFAKNFRWSARAEFAENLYKQVLSRVAPLKSAASSMAAAGI
jgi:glycosyltransferase involved in cell wall biosynthesis